MRVPTQLACGDLWLLPNSIFNQSCERLHSIIDNYATRQPFSNTRAWVTYVGGNVPFWLHLKRSVSEVLN